MPHMSQLCRFRPVRRGDLVVTSDPDDLQSIASAVGRRIEIDHP
jgi:hypothetical protein